jgi:hypothetical protein
MQMSTGMALAITVVLALAAIFATFLRQRALRHHSPGADRSSGAAPLPLSLPSTEEIAAPPPLSSGTTLAAKDETIRPPGRDGAPPPASETSVDAAPSALLDRCPPQGESVSDPLHSATVSNVIGAQLDTEASSIADHDVETCSGAALPIRAEKPLSTGTPIAVYQQGLVAPDPTENPISAAPPHISIEGTFSSPPRADDRETALVETADTDLLALNGPAIAVAPDLTTSVGPNHEPGPGQQAYGLQDTDGLSITTPEPEPLGSAPSPPPLNLDPGLAEQPVRQRRPAVHHDRRGARRAAKTSPQPSPKSASHSAIRQAEARLRLAVDAIRRSIRLSIVLLRPEGFPDSIEVDLNRHELACAFDEARYDDIDVPWTQDLLRGEIRLADIHQELEWIRSARPIHVFAPSEPDLLSVSAARPGIEHSLICRDADIEAVCTVAAASASPPLKVLRDWTGIPAGWAVLTGYRPYKPLPPTTDPRLRALDPGSGTQIQLSGGLEIRRGVYAEGRLPQILIEPIPPGSQVFIGGAPAAQLVDGPWTAPRWDTPGDHLIDVVSGPSLTYTVLLDPGGNDGWASSDDSWPADSAPPAQMPPSAFATISGARVSLPEGRAILATDPAPSIIALGARANERFISVRPLVPAAVAVLPFEPAFLIVSSGLRRAQGKIVWLGNGMTGQLPRMGKTPDLAWISAVLNAAARHLPVYPDTDPAKAAWRSAVAAARRVRRRK